MSLNLYPLALYKPSFEPDANGAEIDHICNEIYAACKGWGTNEKRLLKALGGCSRDQRCIVPARYYQLYGKVLKDVVKSECGGDFGRALRYLSVDPLHAECDMIYEACKGFGTNEIILFSILCGRSNSDIGLLKKKYSALYNRDLVRHLCMETSGNVENLLKWVTKGSEEEYNPKIHTDAKVQEDAAKIYAMGTGRLGTNEDGLFKLFCISPPKHLQAVNDYYKSKYGRDIVSAMQWDMSGIVETGTLMLLRMKLNPYEQIARMIHDAVKGIGTNELLLTTILIRFQSMMGEVNKAYERMYRNSIQRVVKSETSGDYERLLLEILHL